MCFNKFNMTALPFFFILVLKIQNCAAQFLCLYSVIVGLTLNLTTLGDKRNENIKTSWLDSSHFSWGSKFSKFSKKESGFSHKKEGVGKKGGCFKREDITYFHTNLFQCYLSLSVWYVSVFCFLKSVFEEPSLAAPNQRIYDLYK